MSNLTDIGFIKNLMFKHDFTFSKSLGQNFIINPSICPKMVELSNIDENYLVIEIGAGIGVLTKEICKKASKVIVIEIDKKLIPILCETLSDFSNYKVINDDILKVNLKDIIEKERGNLKVCVCANLPYYITSPIIMHILESELDIDFLTVMVQKETGIRITADFFTKNVGSITFSVRYHCNPKILFNVLSGSFLPKPNVDSCVIKLDIKHSEFNLSKSQKEFMFKMIRYCFTKRRKTILNSLSDFLKKEKKEVKLILSNAFVNETTRPEKMDLKDFYNIIKINNII